MDNLSPKQRSRMMGRVKSKHTVPEMIVRRLVFSMGYRYRLHDKRLPGKPDLVFVGRRKVIFVNGCFWHGHVGCRYAHLPKSHLDYWPSKIARNQVRGKENVALLEAGGWKVLIVWECELKNVEILRSKLKEFIERD